MASSMVVAGLGVAAFGFGARMILKAMPNIGQKMATAVTGLQKFDKNYLANKKYYNGGFEPKMTKREAALTLGLSTTAKGNKVQAAYKKLMLMNHPDRGGSPYISSKISEAKDILDP